MPQPDAARRLRTHVRVLRETGAPHQQALADDIDLVVGSSSELAAARREVEQLKTEFARAAQAHQNSLDELALANATIEGMKGQNTVVRTERNDLRETVAYLESELDKTRKERDTAVERVKQLDAAADQARAQQARAQQAMDALTQGRRRYS